jgi:hypothetical protein
LLDPLHDVDEPLWHSVEELLHQCGIISE